MAFDGCLPQAASMVPSRTTATQIGSARIRGIWGVVLGFVWGPAWTAAWMGLAGVRVQSSTVACVVQFLFLLAGLEV